MKRKRKFTRDDINKIKALITQKIRASSADQKGIRDKIRKIGFHATDFVVKQGYDVSDIEMLIREGTIEIIDDSSENNDLLANKLPITPRVSSKRIDNPDELTRIEQELILDGRFRSAKDIDSAVPNLSGFYCIRLSIDSELPDNYNSELLKREHRIIYIGKAEGQSLRKRLLNQELRAIGHGTFFRSIGAVLGYGPPKGSLVGMSNQKNYRFAKEDRTEIIDWINENLEVSCMDYSGSFEIEEFIIRKYKPLLNIKHNPSKLSLLKEDRKKCVRIATTSKT